MEHCTPHLVPDAEGVGRRRPQRRRILSLLHDICLKMERLQQTEDARLACCEVARVLSEALMRENGGRNIEKKV